MTIKTFFSCVLFLCATAGYSQNNTTSDNSIEAQFVEVIDKSNNYQIPAQSQRVCVLFVLL